MSRLPATQPAQAQAAALLSVALASMSEGLVALDSGGAITAINPQAVAMLALPASLAAKARWAEVAAHVAQQTGVNIPALDGAPGPQAPIAWPDGRWVQWQVRKLEVDGVQLGSVLICRDVTASQAAERAVHQAQAETGRRMTELLQSRVVLLSALEDQQQAEAALRASEARFRASFNSAGIGMALKAVDGRWLEVNQRLCDIVSHPAAALLQMTAQQITHPDDRPAEAALLQALLGGRHDYVQREKRYLQADGQPVWVNLTTAVVRDAAGQAQYLVDHVEDIRLRKALEQALDQSQARLRATLDALPDLMFEVGLDGRYHDYHALRSDLQAAPTEVFIGRLVSEVLPTEAAAVVMDALQQAAHSGHTSGQQLALDLPQGQRWFELSAARKQTLPAEGPRFILLSRDITERRRTEAALRRSLADQGALLKEVHHRVKNNLQIMHSLLRLEAGRSPSVETQTVLRDMRGRIQSMALLHESLYRSGSFAGVDLGDYLRQVATQALRALHARAGAVRLQLELASIRLPLDLALPCGLLVNELIGNSLKHGFADGRSGELRVALQVLDDGATLLLQVSDDGVGLPPDFADRQGQSLGLQLVADLAEQLDGQLAIGPAPAARFSLRFRPAGLLPGAAPPDIQPDCHPQ